MMKQLYTGDDVKDLGAKIRKFVGVDIGLIFFALGVGIATCFFVSDSNAQLLETVDIVLSSVCGCAALYFLLNTILPARAKRNYISHLLSSDTRTVRGRVSGEGKRITIVKHIRSSEIRLTDEEGREHILYWDLDNGTPDFEGHIVEFQAVNNKIVGYGEVK